MRLRLEFRRLTRGRRRKSGLPQPTIRDKASKVLKAADFDSTRRRFDPSRPKHPKASDFIAKFAISSYGFRRDTVRKNSRLFSRATKRSRRLHAAWTQHGATSATLSIREPEASGSQRLPWRCAPGNTCIVAPSTRWNVTSRHSIPLRWAESGTSRPW
ncbi:hypothetical protein XH99_14520 [Bradyrhizobium nanningense]|uniref:Uncharacterized protein n=1 Tax=Bradyrhizobium nanningense TaxID=1325118 RepID=A0A4Q0S5V6_9BRAD|nr:hypothetical protein XH99_14520 [Bradyrhizobium nanningense]